MDWVAPACGRDELASEFVPSDMVEARLSPAPAFPNYIWSHGRAQKSRGFSQKCRG
jgi:hypothetical protein